jgi:hypothetical protein
VALAVLLAVALAVLEAVARAVAAAVFAADAAAVLCDDAAAVADAVALALALAVLDAVAAAVVLAVCAAVFAAAAFAPADAVALAVEAAAFAAVVRAEAEALTEAGVFTAAPRMRDDQRVSNTPERDAMRAQCEANGWRCPSCQVNWADLPAGHDLRFDGESRAGLTPDATAKCADGQPVPFGEMDFTAFQLAASTQALDDYRAGMGERRPVDVVTAFPQLRPSYKTPSA